MKPSFGSAFLDDNIIQFTTIHYSFHVINRGYDIKRGHYLKRVVINIRASKNILGLVKFSETSLFLPGTLVSSASDNWLVMLKPQYGRKRDENQNSEFEMGFIFRER